MVGEAVATTLGSSVSPFVLVLAFAFLTSACATPDGHGDDGDDVHGDDELPEFGEFVVAHPKLGDAGYLVPGLATAFLFLIGALDFKEVRNSIASPLILMRAQTR